MLDGRVSFGSLPYFRVGACLGPGSYRPMVHGRVDDAVSQIASHAIQASIWQDLTFTKSLIDAAISRVGLGPTWYQIRWGENI